MDKTESKKKILTTFGILFIIGMISIGANSLLELGYGQINSTGNQNQTSASTPTSNITTAPTITTPTQTNSTTNQTIRHQLIMLPLQHRHRKKHLIL